MNNAFLLLFGNLTSLTCACSACYLAIQDKPGWGWFLFAAVVCAASLKTSEKSKKSTP